MTRLSPPRKAEHPAPDEPIARARFPDGEHPVAFDEHEAGRLYLLPRPTPTPGPIKPDQRAFERLADRVVEGLWCLVWPVLLIGCALVLARVVGWAWRLLA